MEGMRYVLNSHKDHDVNLGTQYQTPECGENEDYFSWERIVDQNRTCEPGLNIIASFRTIFTANQY